MYTNCLAHRLALRILVRILVPATLFLALSGPPVRARPLPVLSEQAPDTGTARAASAEAPVSAPHPFTFDDMSRIGRVGDIDVSPDGTQVAFVVATADVAQNRMSSALFLSSTAGGPARQLTSPPAPPAPPAPQSGPAPKDAVRDGSPRFSPDGRRLAFVSHRGGATQVYVLDLGGGEARKVTALPAGAGGPVWTPDGKSLIVAASVFPECPPLPQGDECNRRRHEEQERSPIRARVMERLFYRHWDSWFDGRRSHLLRVPLDPAGPPVDLTPGDLDTPAVARAGHRPYAVSPDGQELALVQNRDKNLALSTNNDVFVQPLGGAAPRARNLTADNLGTDVTPTYSPDGRYLVYMSQRRPGYEADRWVLWLYDRRTQQRRPLTDALDAHASGPVWALDGRRVYFTTYVAGHSRIYGVGLDGVPPREVGAYGADDLRCVPWPGSPGGALLFRLATMSRPDEIYRLPLLADGQAAGPAVAVTRINDRLFGVAQTGKVSDLWTTTLDGRPLHSYLILPPNFDQSRRYPAVVLIHGGPEGAWEDGWHYRWNPQIYAGAGYVVLMPNPRGSDGFGQRFIDEVGGDWGGKAYDDVMRAVDQLVALPYVNGKKVGALGASYGGYMVNWLAGHTDRFAALVSHDGVYDLASMQGETEELWFPRWEFRGEPWSSDVYQRFSPSRYADKFKTPMLVVTNERDYRVPVGQGMQLFTALQLRGVPSKMLMFPDENHWVLQPGNARLWYATVLDWLHRYLGGAPADAKALMTAASYAR